MNDTRTLADNKADWNATIAIPRNVSVTQDLYRQERFDQLEEEFYVLDRIDFAEQVPVKSVQCDMCRVAWVGPKIHRTPNGFVLCSWCLTPSKSDIQRAIEASRNAR